MINEELLSEKLKYLITMNSKSTHFDIMNLYIEFDNIASQIKARMSYRRAMKMAIASTMRMGAQGIKIKCSGRLGGAEMARTEEYKEGRIPLHTFRSDIDDWVGIIFTHQFFFIVQ